MNNKLLKKYFEFFISNNDIDNWNWYQSLKNWSHILQNIKKQCQENTEISLEECIKNGSNNKLISIEDFLERYLFMQDNGTADIGQGFIYKSKKNPHRQQIIENVKNDNTILRDILSKDNINDVDSKIKVLLDVDRNYDTVRFRFLKTLFCENFTSVDAPNKLYRLTNVLEKKLAIKIEGSPIEKHQRLMKQLKSIDKVENKEVNAYHKQIFYWELYNMLESELNLKKAVVYYGAPGTGKTYKAKQEAKKFIDRWALKNFATIKKSIIETMQFHPSISYEDFIEGIRPTKDKELELKDGVFKSFCKKAGEIEFKLWRNKAFREIAKDKNFEDITVKDIKDKEDIKAIFTNIDFSKIDENLTLQDIIEPAFFIIDEINRADLSRVFGELMYALEYRGYNGKIKTQYSYLVEEKTDSGVYFWEDEQNYFFIPHNVYIIGTMNTIDRSVDSFDFALRRRFSWEEIEPNYEVIKIELRQHGEDIANSFKALNKAIREHEFLGNDYQIGHAYALNIKNKEFENKTEAKEFLWKEFIKPLMQEYLRGLGDSKKSGELLNEFANKFGV